MLQLTLRLQNQAMIVNDDMHFSLLDVLSCESHAVPETITSLPLVVSAVH